MNDADSGVEIRTSEQGNLFEVATIHAFLARLLSDELIADAVNDLLFEHVVAGRYHPLVVAASLRPIIEEVLNTTTAADWQAVAERLIAEGEKLTARCRGMVGPLDITVTVNDSLARALVERGGLREADDRWLAPDGRCTSALAEALLWALVAIAEED